MQVPFEFSQITTLAGFQIQQMLNMILARCAELASGVHFCDKAASNVSSPGSAYLRLSVIM